MLRIKSLWAPKPLFLVALVYTILLTIALLFPSQEPSFNSIKNIDKVFHVILTMLLIIVWLLYSYMQIKPKFSWKIVLLVSGLILIYGIIIEVLQGVYTNTRSADILDVIANLVGIVLGIILFYTHLKSYLKT